MITVTFYRNSSDAKAVTKTLETIRTADCAVYEPSSIYEPILKIQYTASLTNANYVYIPEWNRYYYITEQELQSGGIVYIKCRCDVLMSFASEIKNRSCVIVRQESLRTPELIDNYTQYSAQQIQNYTFPSTPFITTGERGYVLLTVAGG